MTRTWIVVVSTMLLVGCSSNTKGPKRSATAADGIGVVKQEVNKVLAQLETTVAALNDLVNAPKSDLTPQYKHFSNQVNKLEDLAKKVAARNQSMRAKTDAYFSTWERESTAIKDENIRQVSAERRAAAKASFEKMRTEVAAGKAAFTPLMDQLKDIQLYLSNDLTTAGITSCKPIAAEANANAVKVKTALNNVVTELSRVQTELSPAMAPVAN